ncbi:uncharacterized protein K460DRAFT_303804 [Cucurbitaria berberidis CBS 394.84]|uniref:Uncharacterized protein n=1 Tax=Cucurbitaria berberidis CBS 394.84 TaxID=1168544 RepID=A0A9P4GJQ5_9PLEO|nr:uncharacterized protein K460DRAFT_303804 [Cucurbitaria berberidis CBS 394.84]KAF1846887.1 hypothetical protein K460DRAFT_303804 [Cucurbitaria berberidis CBS 394.84]
MRKVVNTIVKDGKSVVVSAATETTYWKRPDSIAEKVGSVLIDSIGSWDGKLPDGTVEVCCRESEHKSDADQRQHITAVCFGAKEGKVTIHVPVKKT